MPEREGAEFWRDLKPIAQVFRPGALPEAYIPDAATDDERYYAPLSETVGTRPLWISPSQNRWCDVLLCRGAGLVNRHYHPQQVFAYTISGRWGYLEHDWVATAGDWIFEAPGEAHTLIAYESDEPMKVTFNVTGPLIWLDEDGQPNGTFDVFDYIKLCRDHYEQRSASARITSTACSVERDRGGHQRSFGITELPQPTAASRGARTVRSSSAAVRITPLTSLRASRSRSAG
jgi:2,4'-dihydroxyacetophenone dioxygenase